MRNRWDPARVRRLSPLDALVYRSRLIGEEPALGLYGGGNTSVKCSGLDPTGRSEEVLWVKGSGADLKGCEPRHFAPLPLASLRPLASRRAMQDEEMVRFFERCLLDPKAPRPSIETLLHAFIPEPAMDHTHADAILAIANSRHGRSRVREALGERLLWIPYLQPGFALSRTVYEAYQRRPDAHGAVLEKHGLITWGSDPKTSYERTIMFVTRAERFLARHDRRWSPHLRGAAEGSRFVRSSNQRRRSRSSASAQVGGWSPPVHRPLPLRERAAPLREWLPAIRRAMSRPRKVCLTLTDTPDVLAFVNARRMPIVARIGPATPDHMLRTKRLPLVIEAGARTGTLTSKDVVRQLERYAVEHRRYVAQHRRSGQTLQDPSPRVILIPGVGMLTSGKDATETARVATIYRHAIWIMQQAESLGGYTSVSAREAFGVEYWPLELHKLSLAPPEPELSREIGLITGAAGGIGRAIAQRLVERGASVVVTDLDRARVDALAEELNRRAGCRKALGVVMDVTRERSIEAALDQVLRVFGGLDFLVSNAGVAHVAGVERLRLADWERSFAVNATGHFLVARAVVQWLRRQELGGSLVFIASKNVLAPGKEFGAYSAAKAAATQLARILAIENGEFGIRANIVNPDGVFDGSGLWAAIGPSRAQTYRLPPERLEAYYQQRNLLKARVLPEDVAEAVAFFVSRASSKTTGCILTVDGGIREAFPR